MMSNLKSNVLYFSTQLHSRWWLLIHTSTVTPLLLQDEFHMTQETRWVETTLIQTACNPDSFIDEIFWCLFKAHIGFSTLCVKYINHGLKTFPTFFFKGDLSKLSLIEMNHNKWKHVLSLVVFTLNPGLIKTELKRLFWPINSTNKWPQSSRVVSVQ